jgi:Asp-tRNA(Asn)/Glu-tRNA(Gln) amidotransferase A subunit family amidase
VGSNPTDTNLFYPFNSLPASIPSFALNKSEFFPDLKIQCLNFLVKFMLRAIVKRSGRRVFNLEVQIAHYSESIPRPENLKEAPFTVSRFEECNAFTSVLGHFELTRHLGNGDIPIAVKDNIDVAGFRTTCASAALVEHPVAECTSPAVQALLDSEPLRKSLGQLGADSATEIQSSETFGSPQLFVMGKTNMDAFGMGGLSTHSVFGRVSHPYRKECSPGGSSGGSAVSVALGHVQLAVGSDTGGSVRQPASYCGIYGFRPTYGRIPRDGLFAYAPSMDTIGLLASDPTILDAAFRAAASTKARDAMYKPRVEIEKPIKKVRLVRLSDDASPCRMVSDKDMCNLEKLLGEGMPHVSVAVEDPVNIRSLISSAFKTYHTMAAAEAASCMARFLVQPLATTGKTLDSKLLGRKVHEKIALGRAILSSNQRDGNLNRAYKHRDEIRNDFEKILGPFAGSNVECEGDTIRILVLPATSSNDPPRIDDYQMKSALEPADWLTLLCGEENTLEFVQKASPPSVQSLLDDALCAPASLAGLPSISVPMFSQSILSCKKEHSHFQQIGNIPSIDRDVDSLTHVFSSLQLVAGSMRDEELLRTVSALGPASLGGIQQIEL